MQLSYAYDGNGARVQKSLDSGTTTYVYDAFGQLAAEYSPASTLSKEYIRMNGQTVAIEHAGGNPCATCYLTYDHLGSIRLVTDQNANVVARHDYLPFGEEIPAGWAGRSAPFGTNDSVNLKFTGQFRDQETGLDYFHARYFGAALGRFTSPRIRRMRAQI
jgi:RHS repeat-associated protein